MADIFNVGDRVRVREFNDMANEYDVLRIGRAKLIKFPYGAPFVSTMEKYCGETGTVIDIIPRENCQNIVVEFDNALIDPEGWTFVNYAFTRIAEAPTELPDIKNLYC